MTANNLLEDKTTSQNSTEKESTEFFDRERWHDVEFENKTQQDEDSESNTVYSSFSIAILLLVIVIAGAGGTFAAYYLSTLIQTPPVPKTDYRTIPAQWIGYVEDSVFLCEINEPTCFTSDRIDTLFLGEASPPSVRRFSMKEKIFQTIPIESKPTALAVGDSEQLFAGKLVVVHTHQIAVYSMKGHLELSWQLPDEKSAIYSIALTHDAVYAADTGKRLIYQFDGQGKLVKSFGQSLTKNATKIISETAEKALEKSTESSPIFPGFAVYLSPITLTVSRKTGLIHIANPGRQRIETFTPEGYWESYLSWGEASSDLSGFAGCCNPVDISTLNDGRIVTAEKFITRVKVYRPDRRLDYVVAGPEILDKPPRNIPQLASFRFLPSETGRPIFVTVFENNNIAVFDPEMRVIRYFTPFTKE